MRAVKWSSLGLLCTAIFEAVVVSFFGSVALLSDMIHNFGDATTAIPLGVAFVLARRPANDRLRTPLSWASFREGAPGYRFRGGALNEPVSLRRSNLAVRGRFEPVSK